ncbi:hypothetical protein ACFLRN_08920 [Thermoproteota archaeon]
MRIVNVNNCLDLGQKINFTVIDYEYSLEACSGLFGSASEREIN